ncbi:MAG: hypothetical protein ACYC2S_09530, partial [Spirochaetales bacterium]
FARIDLEGQSLQVLEMEEIIGGLPRCCHDPEYDAIEDKCLNNKGQRYKEGVNDCDIWVETVLKQAGVDVSSAWGSARTTTAKGHETILSSKLTDNPPLGWSIEIADSNHVSLVRVNVDGSVDVYHQGMNINCDMTVAWESRGKNFSNNNFLRRGNGNNERKYWDF